jgi:hypothetical protein
MDRRGISDDHNITAPPSSCVLESAWDLCFVLFRPLVFGGLRPRQ